MKSQTKSFNKSVTNKKSTVLNELTKEEQTNINGGEIKIVTVCIKGVFVQKIVFV